MSWISIDRKLQGNKMLWNDKPFNRGAAWIDLLLTAQYKDGVFFSEANKCNINGKRGTVYRSINELSQKWGWSRKKTTKFLEDLEQLEMIKMDKEKGSKKTSIFIVNYNVYQPQNSEQRTRDYTSEEHLSKQPRAQVRNINNKYNNNNKFNKSIYSSVPDFDIETEDEDEDDDSKYTIF